MSKQNLYFNILTFDFPSEKLVFYFSKEDIAKSQKIYKSIFPKEIDSLFSGISSNCTFKELFKCIKEIKGLITKPVYQYEL